MAAAIAAAWAAALAACGEAPRWTPRHPTGDPVPSASTSATPLWLRNRD